MERLSMDRTVRVRVAAAVSIIIKDGDEHHMHFWSKQNNG